MWSLASLEFGFEEKVLIATSNQLVVSVVYLVLKVEGTILIKCRV